MRAIQGPEFTALVEKKLGVDLKGRPTMVTARGVSAARDGQIHTDSRTKLITVLIYMNNAWEAKTGRLRLLRGPDNLEDVIAEVPPDEGTLLIFQNEPNAWHGFHAFEGPRRVIQLNWVTDMGVVRREQFRHKVSAFFKRLQGQACCRNRCSSYLDRCARASSGTAHGVGVIRDNRATSPRPSRMRWPAAVCSTLWLSSGTLPKPPGMSSM